jgi:hypothetical protein
MQANNPFHIQEQGLPPGADSNNRGAESWRYDDHDMNFYGDCDFDIPDLFGEWGADLSCFMLSLNATGRNELGYPMIDIP